MRECCTTAHFPTECTPHAPLSLGSVVLDPITTLEIMVQRLRPAFSKGDSKAREVAENRPAKTTVGAAVTVTAPDADTLTYSLSGKDAGSFTIDAATGQLTTVEGVSYDYEAQQSYLVTVAVENPSHAVTTIRGNQ